MDTFDQIRTAIDEYASDLGRDPMEVCADIMETFMTIEDFATADALVGIASQDKPVMN